MHKESTYKIREKTGINERNDYYSLSDSSYICIS